MANNDPAVFQEFREALGARDPKTIAAMRIAALLPERHGQ